MFCVRTPLYYSRGGSLQPQVPLHVPCKPLDSVPLVAEQFPALKKAEILQSLSLSLPVPSPAKCPPGCVTVGRLNSLSL